MTDHLKAALATITVPLGVGAFWVVWQMARPLFWGLEWIRTNGGEIWDEK